MTSISWLSEWFVGCLNLKIWPLWRFWLSVQYSLPSWGFGLLMLERWWVKVKLLAWENMNIFPRPWSSLSSHLYANTASLIAVYTVHGLMPLWSLPETTAHNSDTKDKIVQTLHQRLLQIRGPTLSCGCLVTCITLQLAPAQGMSFHCQCNFDQGMFARLLMIVWLPHALQPHTNHWCVRRHLLHLYYFVSRFLCFFVLEDMIPPFHMCFHVCFYRVFFWNCRAFSPVSRRTVASRTTSVNSCTGLTSRGLTETKNWCNNWWLGWDDWDDWDDWWYPCSPLRKTKLWGTRHEVMKHQVESIVEAWGNVNQVLLRATFWKWPGVRCQRFMALGVCFNDHCSFAHGTEELREIDRVPPAAWAGTSLQAARRSAGCSHCSSLKSRFSCNRQDGVGSLATSSAEQTFGHLPSVPPGFETLCRA